MHTVSATTMSMLIRTRRSGSPTWARQPSGKRRDDCGQRNDSTSDSSMGNATSAFVAVAATDLGDVLVGADRLTHYGFTEDSDGVPTCAGACADAWPPLT